MVPQNGDDLGPAWTAGAGLAGYAWMVLACANPKDTGRTDNPLWRIDLIAIASVEFFCSRALPQLVVVQNKGSALVYSSMAMHALHVLVGLP